MNKKINAYLDEVCSYIRCRKVHPAIRRELTSHILDSCKQLQGEKNISQEEALTLAIRQMGSCQEVGKQLGEQYAYRMEWSVFLCAALLALLGGFFLCSNEVRPSISLLQYALSVSAGALILVGFYSIDLTILQEYAFRILLAVMLGAPLLLSLSPTYVAPLYILCYAGALAGHKTNTDREFLIYAGLALLCIFAFLFFGTANSFLLVTICLYLLLSVCVIRQEFTVKKIYYFAGSALVGVIALAIFFFHLSSYQGARLMAYFTGGASDPAGAGWIPMLLRSLLSHSPFLGSSAADIDGVTYTATQILPEHHTDFALAGAISSFGWGFGIFLMLLYLLFLTRIFSTAAKLRSPFAFYLTLGAGLIFAFSILCGIGTNLGLLPPTSSNLPFLSYGFYWYILNMALLGIILSSWRRNRQYSMVS